MKKGLYLRNLSVRGDDTKYKVVSVGKKYITLASSWGKFRIDRTTMASDFGEKFTPWPSYNQDVEL